MAFSLFSKKPSSPAPAKRPGKSAPVAAAIEEDDFPSLDFTQPGELPKNKGAPRIQVQEVVHEVPAAVEQAAMLHSVGQNEPAAQVLIAAIREEQLGGYERRAWGMLFDLYQALDRQQDYESLALQYAAKFETSPPAWSKQDAAEAVVTQTPHTIGRPGTSLNGVLNGKIRESLEQLLRMAQKHNSVRIDLGKVTDTDEEGAELLLDALRQLKKMRKEFVLGGTEKLAALLAKKLAPGQREQESHWLLLLELYQQMANQAAFEDMAVNYAITFEVSPPSWETVKKPAVVAETEEAPAEPEDNGSLLLEGEISAADTAAFDSLRAAAETQDDILVDASRLRRMDFVAATNLMNLVMALAATGKKVRLVKVSHLVTALWEVIGLDRTAAIETRKI